MLAFVKVLLVAATDKGRNGRSYKFGKGTKMKKKQPKYVYLVSSSTYGANIFLKVGVTSHLENRIRQIGINAPFPVRTVLAVTDKQPLVLEEMVLRHFKHYRIKGEWFCVLPEIDATKCSYREYAQALSAEAKRVEKEMSNYIQEMCSGEVTHA